MEENGCKTSHSIELCIYRAENFPVGQEPKLNRHRRTIHKPLVYSYCYENLYQKFTCSHSSKVKFC